MRYRCIVHRGPRSRQIAPPPLARKAQDLSGLANLKGLCHAQPVSSPVTSASSRSRSQGIAARIAFSRTWSAICPLSSSTSWSGFTSSNPRWNRMPGRASGEWRTILTMCPRSQAGSVANMPRVAYSPLPQAIGGVSPNVRCRSPLLGWPGGKGASGRAVCPGLALSVCGQLALVGGHCGQTHRRHSCYFATGCRCHSAGAGSGQGSVGHGGGAAGRAG